MADSTAESLVVSKAARKAAQLVARMADQLVACWAGQKAAELVRRLADLWVGSRVDVTAVTMEILLVVKRADTKEDRMAEM